MTQVFQNFVNGDWADSRSGDVMTSINPASLSDVVGEFQKSEPRDAQSAVDAANSANAAWGGSSGLARGQYLMKAASFLEQHAEEYAQAITREA